MTTMTTKRLAAALLVSGVALGAVANQAGQAFADPGGTGAGTGDSSGTGAGTGDGGGTGAGTGDSSGTGAGTGGSGTVINVPQYNPPAYTAPPVYGGSNNQWRTTPDYSTPQAYQQPGTGFYVGPVYVPPAPKMWIPAPGYIRLGKQSWEKPSWMNVREMNTINRTTALAESRVGQVYLALGMDPKSADAAAASTMVGGIGGGLAGAGTGALAVGATGAAIGTIIGIPVGAVLGGIGGGVAGGALGGLAGGALATIPAVIAFFPTGGASAALIPAGIAAGASIGVPLGVLVGIPAGAVAGGIAGGILGATVGIPLGGIPGAALGAWIGNALGGGDPNADPNPSWLAKDSDKKIVVIDPDWEGYAQGDLLVPRLVKRYTGISFKASDFPGAMTDFQVSVAGKDGKKQGILIATMGEERWIGGTEEDRQKFYDSLPNDIGKTVGPWAENQGVQMVKDTFAWLAKTDPDLVKWNPDGAVDPNKDPKAPKDVPLGSTPTPNPWKEPNRDGLERQQDINQKAFPVPYIPSVEDAQRALGLPTQQQAPQQSQSAPQATQAVAPTQAPAQVNTQPQQSNIKVGGVDTGVSAKQVDQVLGKGAGDKVKELVGQR